MFDKPRSVYVVLLEDSQFNEKTLAALKEIENGGGKVFENVEELFKDLNYHGCRESHLEPDWLLIYKTEEIELTLVRTGSHSELF
ncbi:type II toxin-antitoxin system mRNA interferase toxin, RelE/StbE family [Candidatus Marithrix sp. Canyon 246]|nr:type II toxin-antitoxin system mRNA interferase toxin, RelE/StbE family [Candidatus Marithrix sp. Canyon 246]